MAVTLQAVEGRKVQREEAGQGEGVGSDFFKTLKSIFAQEFFSL